MNAAVKSKPKRMVPQTMPERDEKTKLRRETIGARIQKLRYQHGFTQDVLAGPTGRGRSAVAQWERDDCEPPLKIIESLAKTLKTTPQYLAFGITGEPLVVAPDPETLGYVLVSEITFGESATERTEVGTWGVPVAWLKAEGQVPDANACVIYKVEYDAAGYQFGDRVLIDLHTTRVSPPGVFLHWDGFGPALSQITPIHGQGGKPVVRVHGAGEAYECPVDNLHIIGRVRGLWRKA